MNTGAVIITANGSSPANSKIPSYLLFFIFLYTLYTGNCVWITALCFAKLASNLSISIAERSQCVYLSANRFSMA